MPALAIKGCYALLVRVEAFSVREHYSLGFHVIVLLIIEHAVKTPMKPKLTFLKIFFIIL